MAGTGHPDRPPPLRSQKISSDGVPLGFRQPFPPLPHGFVARAQAVENQRDFSRRLVFYHPAPYMVLLYRGMYRQASCLGLAMRKAQRARRKKSQNPQISVRREGRGASRARLKLSKLGK
jgi:hypothetical protein